MVKRKPDFGRDLFLRELGFEPNPVVVEEFGRLSPIGAKQLEEAVIDSFKFYCWDRFRHQLKPPSSEVEHDVLPVSSAK
jgi:hypothetical protein